MKLGGNCARSTKTAYAARVWRKQRCTVAILRIMSQTLNTNRRMILLLGGARAGKSTYAMRLAQDGERTSVDEVCFIATAQGLDEDMTKRIARHRAERSPHWRTIEEPCQIDEALRQASEARIVIVDCLTLFVSNWLMRHEDEHECEQFVRRITRNFLELTRTRQQTIICVSNEVGLGVVPDTNLGRVFRDLLGRVNQEFAAAADEVYLLIAGLPLQLKPTA
jgi:adenosylcobinamide kinase / adenosylcobinamide-phosphate guanylyltransferase